MNFHFVLSSISYPCYLSMTSSASETFRVRGDYVLSSGIASSFDLFSHRITQDLPLRWELRYLFPALGYFHTSQNIATHVRVKEFNSVWTVKFPRMGLRPFNEHFGKPRQSFRVLAANDGDASNDFWISSGGLVGLFLQVRASRKTKEDRERSLQVSNLVLTKILPADVASATSFLTPASDVSSLCQQLPLQNGSCHCLSSVVREIAGNDSLAVQPQVRLLNAMSCMFK